MRLLTARNLLVLLLAGMLNAASSASGENSAEQSVSARPDLSSDELALIELTNAERKRAGLALLIPDPALMRMAREHSRSMARLQQLSHTIEGRSFSVRLMDSEYRSTAAGENVAEGQVDAAEAVQDWMNSPGHRKNIMTGQYSQIGVAVSRSRSGRRFYTQIFARPLPPADSSDVDRGARCPSCRDIRRVPLTKDQVKDQERQPGNAGRTGRVVKPNFKVRSGSSGSSI